jgi:hypothetical protein
LFRKKKEEKLLRATKPNLCVVYRQNFSREKDTCYYVYLKPGICILSKQDTQLYLYLTNIVKGKNPLSNEKKYTDKGFPSCDHFENILSTLFYPHLHTYTVVADTNMNISGQIYSSFAQKL